MNDDPMIEREALTFGATARASLKDCSDSSTIIISDGGGGFLKGKRILGNSILIY